MTLMKPTPYLRADYSRIDSSKQRYWISRISSVLALGYLSATSVFADDTAKLSSWTRAEDQKSIQASLVAFDHEADEVSLKLANGKEVTINASVLIAEDQERLAAFTKASEAQKALSAKSRMDSYEPEGAKHKVHVYRPAGYIDNHPSSESRPVAFLFSAGGKSAKIVNRCMSIADELGWVLVGIDAYKNTSSLTELYDERMRDTKIAFEWAQQNISFDPEKIVFGGLSGGGWWSFQSASDLTRDAAGILSFGGWMGKMHDKNYSKKMAVAQINGDKDKAAISAESYDGRFLEKKARAKVKAFHFPGGHVLAPAEVALEAARWIHETKEFGDH